MKTSKLTFQSTVFGLQPVKILAGFAAMFLMAGVGNAEIFYIYPSNDEAGNPLNWSNTTDLWSSVRGNHTLATEIPDTGDSVYASYYTATGTPVNTINIDVDPVTLTHLRSYSRTDTQPANQVTLQPTGGDRSLTMTGTIGGQGTSDGGGPMILQSTASHKLSVSAGYIGQFGADLYLGGTTADSALDEVITTNTGANSVVWRPVYLNAASVEIKNTVNMGGNSATLKGDLYLHNNEDASEDKTIKISALTGTGDAAAPEAATIYASKAYEGATARQATMELTGTSGTHTTLAQLKDNPGGDATMTLRVTKTGGSTQILESGLSDYSGGTDISAGSLLVNNTSGNALGTGEVKVHTAGLIGGSGSFTASLVVDDGGTVSPGESIESLETGDNTWNSGGAFTLELSTDGSSGSAGSEWDQLVITGDLDLSETTSADPFTINVVSMANATDAGEIATWDETAAAPWAGFVTTTDGIVGFSADKFAFNTNDFQNALFGSFSVEQNGDNLDLTYTAIPEPSSLVLLGVGALAFFARRRLK